MPLWSDLDISRWDYKEPRKLPNGSYNSFIDDAPNSRRTPEAQLDECVAKFGVSPPPEQNPNSNRRNMDLSVTSKTMAAFWQNVDDRNCEAAAAHSTTSFNKTYSAEMVKEALYTATLKPHEKYDPLLRTKIVLSGKKKTKIYVVQGKDPESGEDLYVEGNVDDITPYSRVVPIVEFSSLWYASRNCGMTVLVKKLMVWPDGTGVDDTEFEGLHVRKKARISGPDAAPSVSITGAPDQSAAAPAVSMSVTGGDDDDVM